MKYFPLVWAGIWRKRARTILTMLSIIVAFLLFGLLQGINAGFRNVAADQRANRLYVVSRVSLIEPLPFALGAQIEAIPGIDTVAHQVYFGGFFQERANTVSSLAVDPRTYFRAFPEITAEPAHIQAMSETRTGAMIGAGLAARMGWKAGDRVTMQTYVYNRVDGPPEWPVDIVGIFQSTRPQDNNTLVFNYGYFDEPRTQVSGKGTVGYYVVTVRDPAQSAATVRAIDTLFANSANETRTQTEKELAQTQAKQLGDLGFFVTAIIGAVLFTLLFLTANTMAQSVRERVPELAVLKTLGFTDTGIVALVVTEAVVLCVIAALMGLGLAWLAFPAVSATFGFASFTWAVLLTGIGVAVLLAVASALPPAWRAQRLEIADTLAQR